MDYVSTGFRFVLNKFQLAFPTVYGLYSTGAERGCNTSDINY